MKQKKMIFVFVLMALILLLKMALGQVPRKINYQGFLTDSNGRVIEDSTIDMTFSIYDSSKNNCLWSETQNVSVKHGLYNVQLGSVKSIPYSLFSGGDRYLKIKICNIELTPEAPILSVGYAIRANRSDSTDFVVLADSCRKSHKADSTDYATLADSSRKAYFADITGYVELADSSRKSHIADRTDYATLADSSRKAHFADITGYVELADSSRKSHLADSTYFTTLADSSRKAHFADITGYVELADSSRKSHIADRTDYATLADSSRKAHFADITGYVELADSSRKSHIADRTNYATLADSSRKAYFADITGYVALADSSRKSHLADTSDYATLSDRSEIADYAHDSDKLDGYNPGNQRDMIPINNGAINNNLNADMLDSLHASVFFDSLYSFKIRLKTHGVINNTKNPVDWTKLKNVPSCIANTTIDSMKGGTIQGEVTIKGASKNGLSVKSDNGNAIYIESTGANGIHIEETNVHGIFIKSASNEGLRIDSTGGYGVFIDSTKLDGVRINNTGEDACGIRVNYAGKNGVFVHNAGEYGIRATGNKGGGKFVAPPDTSKYALYVESYSGLPSNKALRVNGTSHFTGRAVSDSGFFNKTKNGNYFLSSISSPDVEIFASGTATLNHRMTHVEFENAFQQSISQDVPLKIILTPGGFAAGLLCVTKRSTQGFEVRLQKIPGLENFPEDVSFDWIAIGRRKGFEIRPKITLTDE